MKLPMPSIQPPARAGWLLLACALTWLACLPAVFGASPAADASKGAPQEPVNVQPTAAPSAIAAAPQPTTEPKAREFLFVRSLFVDNPTVGRDPFFPNSTRRGPKVMNTNTTVVVPPSKLTLNGLSGSRQNRLAIINHRTFSVGEEAEVRVDGQPVKVRCLEIRDKSVVVTVNGDNQEVSFK